MHGASFKYFNPRSSCEERRYRRQKYSLQSSFQSTLLMRGATKYPHEGSLLLIFQSTLLMRGATHVWLSTALSDNFNPRSSCEERRKYLLYKMALAQFQSTLLMRGATHIVQSVSRYTDFNPRSSCEERLHCWICRFALRNFNPRSSCEERQRKAGNKICLCISIHAPHARSDIRYKGCSY